MLVLEVIVSTRFEDSTVDIFIVRDTDSRINLRDSADLIQKKIKKAKTDSEPIPDNKEALSKRPEAFNLINI